MKKYLALAAIVAICALWLTQNSNFEAGKTFKLFDSGKTAILRPVIYYNLPNGSVIEVRDSNPFPFTIELASGGLGINAPSKSLEVYTYETYKKPEEIKVIAKSFGASLDKLYYNEITHAYLYNDEKLSFEYYPNTGYLRILFKNSSLEKASILNGLLNYSYQKIEKNGRVFYARNFDGLSSNVGLLVKSDEKGIRSIEGILLKSVKLKGKYELIPIDRIPEMLEKRVKGDLKADDWYLSNIAFTKLTLTNVSLMYTITPDGILPVYWFEGKYELDFEGIKDSGTVEGRIVAVSAN